MPATSQCKLSVSGFDRTREVLRDLIMGGQGATKALTLLIRLNTQLIIEEALEAESRDLLGRAYYEHGAQPGQGYHKGNPMGG